jgi:hypothetical protein
MAILFNPLTGHHLVHDGSKVLYDKAMDAEEASALDSLGALSGEELTELNRWVAAVQAARDAAAIAVRG